MRSERIVEYHPPAQNAPNPACDVAHLDFLWSIDARSVETLCIDDCARRGGIAVEFLKEALGLGNVKTLILSRSAVLPCLLALNMDPGASDHTRWFSSMHTLIIHPDPDQDLRYLHDYLYDMVFPRLLSIAQGKKVAGSPFGSVSLFIRDANPRWRLDPVLEELRRCVGELEVVLGDDILDWDIDKYFLDGLDHLQKMEMQNGIRIACMSNSRI